MQLVCESDVKPPKTGTATRIVLSVQADVITIRLAANPVEGTHQLISVCGLPFVTHLPEHDGVISRTLQSTGVWEPLESTVLLSVLRPGMTVVDAGANIGYYTSLLSSGLGGDGAIYAFEPERRNFEILMANVLLARHALGVIPAIYLDSRAVSDSVGQATLNVFQENLGFHSLEVQRENGMRRQIHTVTLDSLRGFDGESEPVIRKQVDLIKADVQGAELRLLRGAAQTIEQDHPMLCLEFEPYLTGDRPCLQLLDWLVDHGYCEFQLFHSNCDQPRGMVEALARTLNAQQIRDCVREKKVGAYGTLFTVHPDSTSSGRRQSASLAEIGA